MTFKLSDAPKAKYSPLEKNLFERLPEFPLSANSSDLAKATRRRGPNARTIVVGAMRSLAAKAIRNREPWRIKNSLRRGPHAMSFWVEGK